MFGLRSRKIKPAEYEEGIKKALKKLEDGCVEECLSKLRELADKGSAEAEYWLGDVNEFILKDDVTAAKWYELSAKHGYPKSQWCIANLLMIGKGMPKDTKKALKWYHKAAESGVAEAMFTLGESYRTGMFITKDQESAKRYYLQSAESGYEPARRRYQQYYGELPNSEELGRGQRDAPSETQRKRKSKIEKAAAGVNSIQAVFAEAEKQGWLVGQNVNFIPEIMGIYGKASDYFLQMIEEADPKFRETLAFHVSRYLFAKGVEGVIQWGASPKGNISVFFHPKHLHGVMEFEIPPEYRHLVDESVKIGENLFRAHQINIMERQTKHNKLDIRLEMYDVINWMPRLGISYALNKGYHELNPSGAGSLVTDNPSPLELDKEALLDPHLYPFLDKGIENTTMFLLTLSRDEILKSAQLQGLTKGDQVRVPEEAVQALARLAGDLRNDLYHHHEVIQKQLQLPIVNNCFTYAFAKGAEYGLRKARGEENPGMNYLGEDALEGRAGAQVEPDQANTITRAMEIAWDVFCDIQDNIIKNPSYRTIMDGRKLADLIGCLFFWAGVIGYEYAGVSLQKPII